MSDAIPPTPGDLRPHIESLRQLWALNDPRAHQELMLPERRRTIYASRLISCFAEEESLLDAALAALDANRQLLERLLSQRGEWDGQDGLTLDEALSEWFDGLATLKACADLWDQVGRLQLQMPGLIRAREQAVDIFASVGLTAPWAGPVLLAAWLRHLLRMKDAAPHLPAPSFSLWPAGPRTIYDLVPDVTISSSWDPEGESKKDARRRLIAEIDGILHRIETLYRENGFGTFKFRHLDRDVRLTYLRLRWPQRWTWAELSNNTRPLLAPLCRRRQ